MITRGIHFALYEDSDGVKLVFKLRLSKLDISKVKVLKKRRVEFVKAPEMAYPSMLTEMPTGRVYDTGDIISGEPEPIKLIDPEDM